MRKMFVAAACLAATVAAAANTTRYTVVDLGPSFNPAFGGVAATAMNDRGEITGWSYSGQFIPMHHAFVWDSGTTTDLGVPAGSFESTGWGINNRGTVLGTNANGLAAIYRDGTWTMLGINGDVTAINDHDTIVGAYTIPGVARHAYMIRNGAFIDMGSLGGTFSIPFAVNNKHVAVGYSYLTQSVTLHGFIHEGGVMKDMGTLGGANSYAYDVNDHGVAVGGSQDAQGRTVAMMYSGGVMSRIPGLGTFSYAKSINDHGDVIGYSDGHVFLYQDGKVTLLDQLPEVAASGWRLGNPVAINDRGWVLVNGSRDGRSGSVVLIPK